MQTIEKNTFIKGFHEKHIFLRIWENVTEPKAIVQIFHGMGEHSKRYSDFALFLNSQGFIVYACDQRGHGKTADSPHLLGYIGQNGFHAIVEDQYIITQEIKTAYPNLPVIIFGHSFGSFIAQEYLIHYGQEIHAVILSGSALQKGLQIQLGAFIAACEYCFRDETKEDQLATFLAFSSYNKKFNDSASKFRWLSSDKEQVHKYEKDPYCGSVFPVNFYYHFLKGLKTLYKRDKLIKIRKNLPVLILSGENDPVGNYSQSVKKLYHFYQNLGLTQVTLKIFSGMRHELTNEMNKKEVYLWLANWLNKLVEKINAAKTFK